MSRLSRVLIMLMCIAMIHVYSLTDLTYLNCPSGFDVTIANTSSPSKQFVQFFFSLYDNPQQQAQIQSIVINNKDSELFQLILTLIIPFIIITVGYFIFFMIVVCCNVFQKSCPPCQSWRRDFSRRPYEKNQLKCAMVFTIIFATAIFAVSIVMFTSFPVFRQQLEFTKCSLYTTLDVTSNGDQSKNWGGFNQLKNQVGNISSLLTTASNQINTNFRGADGLSNDDWIVDDMQSMKQQNLNLYRNNNDSKVTTPNPFTTASTSLGTPLPKVDSYFIINGFGPNSSDSKMTSDIDKGFRLSQTLSNQAYLVEKSALTLVNSAVTITANTNASQSLLTMYQSQLGKVQVAMDLLNKSYFQIIFGWFLYVVEGIVGFILAASIFIIFGTISTHILDILACRTLVNIGWVIYAIAYFGIILITIVFMPGGSLAFGFCQYNDSMLTTRAQFNRLGQAYSQNALNRLDVCIYGDGNVLQKFSIANEMQTVSDLFTNIQTYYDYNDPTNVKYINASLSTAKIESWIYTMEQYRLGVYIDANPSLTTYDNANYVLTKFNQIVQNKNSNNISDSNCPRDVWVFDVANCTDPSAQNYTATNQTNGLRFTSSNDLCIPFNSRLQSDFPDAWSIHDFTLRYQQTIHSCPSYLDIISYGSSLINYRDSRYNLYQGLKDQLNSLLINNQQFNKDLVQYKGRVDRFYSSVSTINNLVMDKTSGLLVSSDCRVVKDYLIFFNNVFCQNALKEIATLGLSAVILMALMIGGIITASVFAVRYARIQTVEKHSRRIVIPEGSLTFQTFDKKQSTQSSQSSSDED